MSKPLVTVFIPVYNCELYIKQCLDSVINQTYDNLDILIIDDGSTDKSISIIESYRDNRIRLIKNNVNRGIPYTRNKGISESRGKYMAIMDADDICNKYRIEKQVEILEKYEDIDVVSSYHKTFTNLNDLNENKVERIYIYLKKMIKGNQNKPLTDEQIKIGLLFSCVFANPASMIRLTTLKEHDIKYNKDCFVAQDYELWTQISKIGKFHLIDEELLYYRFGHENITKTSMYKKFEKRKIVLDKIHDNILDFYNFELNDDEKIIFNDFFKEDSLGNLSNNDKKDIKNLIQKLIIKNKSKSIFNEKDFISILDKNIFCKINYSQMKLLDKINFYNSINNKSLSINQIKRIIVISITHLYRKLLN